MQNIWTKKAKKITTEELENIQRLTKVSNDIIIMEYIEGTMFDDLDISDDTILEHLKTFFNKKDVVQGNLINPNQSNRQVESVSYNLFNKVIRNHFKGERKAKLVDIHTLLIDKLGLDKHNFLVEID